MYYHIKVIVEGEEKSLFKVLLRLGDLQREDEFKNLLGGSRLLDITPGRSTFPNWILRQLDRDTKNGNIQFWFTEKGYQEFLLDRREILGELDRYYPYKEAIFKVLKTPHLANILYQDEMQVISSKTPIGRPQKYPTARDRREILRGGRQ
jgi:hypothetical protein